MVRKLGNFSVPQGAFGLALDGKNVWVSKAAVTKLRGERWCLFWPLYRVGKFPTFLACDGKAHLGDLTGGWRCDFAGDNGTILASLSSRNGPRPKLRLMAATFWVTDDTASTKSRKSALNHNDP
jgi:hypothetical protein